MRKKRSTIFLLLLLGIVSALPYFKSSSHPPKIYDCFLFFNELELLQIRLHEMAAHVDHFVIVEAIETFRGQPKAMTFAENRHLFEKFADKIIYIPVTERLETDDPWVREHYQRDQIFRGLKKCHPSDVIIISDLDEIVRGSCIEEIARTIASEKSTAVVCEQKMHFGYLNRYQDLWPGSVAITYKDAKKHTASFIRRLRNQSKRKMRKAGIKKMHVIKDAGWHFTSMGGMERYVKKMESYSHQEYDRPEMKTLEHFTSVVQAMKLVEVDKSFPLYVQENRAHFEEICFLDIPI